MAVDKLKEREKKTIKNKRCVVLGVLLCNQRICAKKKSTVPCVVCNTHLNSSEIYRNLEIYLHKMGDSAKQIVI